jgi:hypothetical protein
VLWQRPVFLCAGRRRILVPPQLGWTGAAAAVGPPPVTYGAARRLANYRDGPLLFEAELVRVREAGEAGFDIAEYEGVQLASAYRLPPPPMYGQAMRRSGPAT